MKHIALAAVAALTIFAAASCGQKSKDTTVVLETSMGDIEILLYNDTPLHKANFLDKVESGYWDGRTFNRVVEGFLIQCGYEQEENYIPEKEIRFPKYINRRGIVGMGSSRADVLSNSEQFYIEWGHVFTDEELDRTQERLDRETGGTVKLTDEIREVYKTVGGSPHLDGQYTIFGEVTKGLDVVEAIQAAPAVDEVPLEEVVIYRAYVK